MLKVVRAPCNCLLCQAADVTDLPVVLVPGDATNPESHELHGEPLRRYHDARRACFDGIRAAIGGRGRHNAGFERLVNTRFVPRPTPIKA